MPDVGVITEQGFVAGDGLGFAAVTEQDSKNIEESLKNKETATK